MTLRCTSSSPRRMARRVASLCPATSTVRFSCGAEDPLCMVLLVLVMLCMVVVASQMCEPACHTCITVPPCISADKKDGVIVINAQGVIQMTNRWVAWSEQRVHSGIWAWSCHVCSICNAPTLLSPQYPCPPAVRSQDRVQAVWLQVRAAGEWFLVGMLCNCGMCA